VVYLRVSDSPAAPAPRYIPIDRKQLRLEPLDVERLIEDDHPARKIWRVVEQLDLSRFDAEVRAVEGVAGRPSHSPQVLVAVWIYAFSRGLHSAREVERQMHYEPGLRWLTGLNVINYHKLSDFRVGYGEALRELFEQVLAMLTMKGLITLERVAVDGTKIRADAGKKSFGKRAKIEAHLKLAREHLDALERAERDEHATQRQQAADGGPPASASSGSKKRSRRSNGCARPKRTIRSKEPQASSSDPTAAFMRMHDGGVAPGYNVQITADSAHGLIADIEVVNDPQDSQQIAPAMDRLKDRQGCFPQQALADGAYTNLASVMEMHERSIDYYSTWTGRNAGVTGRAKQQHEDYRRECFEFDETRNELICPEGKRLAYRYSSAAKGREQHSYRASAEDCGPCPARALCCPKLSLANGGRSVSFTIHDPVIEAFDEKMAQPEALAIYKKRAPLAEFPNAWIKAKLKLRRFATRGLAKVQSEAVWAALTFNLQTDVPAGAGVEKRRKKAGNGRKRFKNGSRGTALSRLRRACRGLPRPRIRAASLSAALADEKLHSFPSRSVCGSPRRSYPLPGRCRRCGMGAIS
jgi:transposase